MDNQMMGGESVGERKEKERGGYRLHDRRYGSI